MNTTRRPALTPLTLALAAGGAAAALGFVYVARAALFPFLAAYAIAYLFDPLIDRLVARGARRPVAVALLMALLITLALGFAAIVAPLVWDQVDRGVRALPVYLARLEAMVAPMADAVGIVDADDLRRYARDSFSKLGGVPASILEGAAGAFWSAVSGAMGAAAALFNLLLIPVAAAYLLNDFDRLNAAILFRAPPRHRGRVAAFFRKIDAVLWGFVRGQLTVALINALILSVGLTLVGAPMGLFIGLAAGLASIVPYLMAVVGLVPALVLSYLSDGGWLTMALVAGVFAAAQALEGFVISPWALEKAVGLHPVAVMAALLIGGMFFGFLGVLLAVPAAAALKVALAELDAAYINSEFFNHPGQQ